MIKKHKTILFSLIICCALLCSCAGTANTTKPSKEAELSLWTDNSALKTELVKYMNIITDINSSDYIPPEERVAVFDLDGTLFCETDPAYFDHMLLVYRVLEDPEYKEIASFFEKQVANVIVDRINNNAGFSGIEVSHGQAVSSAFKGMTVSEFYSYIADFKNQPAKGYEGMKIGDAFYLPMIQVVNYLISNDFSVYVVSGTDRFIVRGLLNNSILEIPPMQIIGSDEELKATNQGYIDGMDYTLTENDEVVLSGNFIIKNLKMNKVKVIVQEIGIKPVLSFGNSSGDSAMAEYTTTDNRYKSLAFMLCCDDLVRENGDMEKAQKMYELCEKHNWVPISMKNDWKTIYGDNVTRK